MKNALCFVCLWIWLSSAEAESLPKGCADSGKDGLQFISVPYSGFIPFLVFCDAETMNGNWTVIQRRINGDVDFYRPWSHYKNGFGNYSAEYWMGLARLHMMTTYETQEWLVVIVDFNNVTKYAHYGSFKIGNEKQFYKLYGLGQHSADAENSLRFHTGANLVTYNRDTATNCARNFKTGLWVTPNQPNTNLNGVYMEGQYNGDYPYGIYWRGVSLTEWHSLKSVKMMIRPKQYFKMAK